MTARVKLVRPKAAAEVICWIDHSEPLDRQPWEHPSVPSSLTPLIVWSLGFVTSENADIVELSRDATEHGTVGGALHILKRCIVYRRRVAVRAVRSK